MLICLISLIFGWIFDKMQFYFFGHIFQDIWNFLIKTRDAYGEYI